MCNGRIVFSQEGGYSETHVPFCGLAVLEEMIDKERRFIDPVKETIIHQGGEDLIESQIKKIFTPLKIKKQSTVLFHIDEKWSDIFKGRGFKTGAKRY